MEIFPSKVRLSFLLVFALFLLWPAGFDDPRCPIAFRSFTFDRLGITGKGILNERAYRIAMGYFNANKEKIRNRRYLTIIDYTKPSFKKRMYIIDLRTGEVRKHFVSHGKNSGRIYAVDFSNEADSLKSCKGFFLTGREYVGKHGTALVLHGLQKGINDRARERGIVIHGADYAGPKSILINGGRLGRSWGCPAVPLGEADQIIDRIKNGSLLYIHA